MNRGFHYDEEVKRNFLSGRNRGESGWWTTDQRCPTVARPCATTATNNDVPHCTELPHARSAPFEQFLPACAHRLAVDGLGSRMVVSWEEREWDRERKTEQGDREKCSGQRRKSDEQGDKIRRRVDEKITEGMRKRGTWAKETKGKERLPLFFLDWASVAQLF